jgi:adenine-specific DNA-methyltransferase
MKMANFFDTVIGVLKQNERFFSAEGELLRNAVYEAAMKMDADLLKLLFNNEVTRERFFTDIDGISVFDKVGFGWVINNREFLPDSYTRYKNKIGLTNGNGDYISTSNDVELVFPYKDCVLEGGQTKDDQKRSEIFYNETLAPDEVDRLLYPKVLVNATRHSKDGEERITEISENDNLFIKGNNIFALASLLKRYEGKIKCIYIDPPYNTRSDANTFAYNNTFNHSTWLTFMKNRLELARKLLSDDGIIYIDIDHYELFYLDALADEIFGYENRLGVLAVVHNLKGRYSEFFSVAHENKLVYAKNAENAVIKDYQFDNSDSYPLEDSISKYKLVGLQRTGNGSLREERPNLFYPVYYNPTTEEVTTTEKEGFVAIYPIDSEGIERRWRWGKSKIEEEWKTEIVVKQVKGEYKIYTKIRIKGDRPKTLWNRPEYSGTTGTNELKDLVSHNEFSYPKSVQLVVDSLQIATDEDSIVLDFFGGSGTTGQAVMDLNKRDNGCRKFILVEQMDYINTVSVPRLKAVIKKNNTGSFVYCELAKLNQKYVEDIQTAATDADIASIWDDMAKTGFISCKVNPSEIDMNAADFTELSLDDKKRFLMELLDKNQLYVNYCDMEDETFAVSEEDKAFSKSFYGEM